MAYLPALLVRPAIPIYKSCMKRWLYWLDLLFFLYFAYWAIRFSTWGPRMAVGVTIAAIGVALWITARIQLGRSFSVSAQARELVTSGLYRRFRNPIYTFSLVGFAGMMISAGWWWGLLLIPGAYAMQSVRSRQEEKVLEQAL